MAQFTVSAQRLDYALGCVAIPMGSGVPFAQMSVRRG
jgi:hypothetical protein